VARGAGGGRGRPGGSGPRTRPGASARGRLLESAQGGKIDRGGRSNRWANVGVEVVSRYTCGGCVGVSATDGREGLRDGRADDEGDLRVAFRHGAPEVGGGIGREPRGDRKGIDWAGCTPTSDAMVELNTDGVNGSRQLAGGQDSWCRLSRRSDRGAASNGAQTNRSAHNWIRHRIRRRVRMTSPSEGLRRVKAAGGDTANVLRGNRRVGRGYWRAIRVGCGGG